jgi:hypothetical protein
LPTLFTDPSGRWATEDHARILDKAFVGVLPSLEVQLLKLFDESQDGVLGTHEGWFMPGAFLVAQSPWLAYQHAMRAPWETPAAAEQKFDAYLAENRRLASRGSLFVDLEALGKNAHALADRESPSHRGFQQWPPSSIKGFLDHTKGEANPSDATIKAVADKVKQEYDDHFSETTLGRNFGVTSWFDAAVFVINYVELDFFLGFVI